MFFYICEIPSGHRDMFVHPLMTVTSGPGQGFLPRRELGFTHRLILNCMPPMFFVQWLHWLQVLQPPLTATKRNSVFKDCMLIYALDILTCSAKMVL